MSRTASHVKIEILNLMGRHVTTLIDRFEPEGIRTVEWNGSDVNGNRVASGIYLYRITADNFISTKKMALLK